MKGIRRLENWQNYDESMANDFLNFGNESRIYNHIQMYINFVYIVSVNTKSNPHQPNDP